MAGCKLGEVGLLSQKKKTLGGRGRRGDSSLQVYEEGKEKGNNLSSRSAEDQTGGSVFKS